MTESILREINTRNAYVMEESRARALITFLNNIHMRDGPIFRIMKEHKCTYVGIHFLTFIFNLYLPLITYCIFNIIIHSAFASLI